jgi:hypothetical protein
MCWAAARLADYDATGRLAQRQQQAACRFQRGRSVPGMPGSEHERSGQITSYKKQTD